MDIKPHIQTQISAILTEMEVDGKFAIKVAEKCAAGLETKVNEMIKKNAKQEIAKAIRGLTGGAKKRSSKSAAVKVGGPANQPNNP